MFGGAASSAPLDEAPFDAVPAALGMASGGRDGSVSRGTLTMMTAPTPSDRRVVPQQNPDQPDHLRVGSGEHLDARLPRTPHHG